MNQVNIHKLPVSNYEMNESMNVLRTNLAYSSAKRKVVLFTSSEENAGKSTVSFQFAISCARAAMKVLFVDADLRKSVLYAKYGISAVDKKPLLGMTDYLTGNARAEDVVYATAEENLSLAMVGHVVLNPTPLFASELLTDFLNKARAEYDIVIVDSPPLGRVIDAAVIAPACDGTVIVLNYGDTTYDSLNAVKRQLQLVNANILGCVLNKAEHESKGYYSKKYSYRESYGKSK